MGVERAVTRWHVKRQTLLAEIADLEAQIAQAQSGNDLARMKERLAQAQAELLQLGPSPQPKMG